MALLASINKLKETVLHSYDPDEAWTRFFDLTQLPQFLDASHPCNLDTLTSILEEIHKTLIPDSTSKLQIPLILRCGNTDFYHGPLVNVGGTGAGTFLYFDEACVGMAILARDAKNTKICRFAAKVLQSPHCFAPATESNAHALPILH